MTPGVLLSQFQISKSLKPIGTGEPFLWIMNVIQGVNPFKVGLLNGPNPTANLVSVI